MEFVGYSARVRRLMLEKNGRYFGLTVDHSMARGVMEELDTFQQAIDDMCVGGSDAITMHKGLAEWCFGQHTGITPLVLKCTTFSPYQPDFDTPVATVEESVGLGADTVSIGCIVCRDEQPQQLSTLIGHCEKARELGTSVISHIYPEGNRLKDGTGYDWKNVLYATRVMAELGVDLIKTNYTGDPESFAKVVEGTPSMVVTAGGDSCRTPQELLKIAKDVLDSGAAEVTYGRFIIQYPKITPMVRVVKSIIHGGYSVKEAVELSEELEHE